MEYRTNDKYIFISYSHTNSDRVMQFIQRLQQDKFSLWYDNNIHNSVWGASIENALDNSSVVLLFVTPESLDSNNVFNEISFADNAKKSIYCIYLSDTNISDYPGWRLMLTKCQAFYAYKDGDDAVYLRLKKCLLEILEGQGGTREKKIIVGFGSRRTQCCKRNPQKKSKGSLYSKKVFRGQENL